MELRKGKPHFNLICATRSLSEETGLRRAV
jgi:hypothetical protein